MVSKSFRVLLPEIPSVSSPILGETETCLPERNLFRSVAFSGPTPLCVITVGVIRAMKALSSGTSELPP